MRSKLAAIGDDHRLRGLAALRPNRFNLLHHVHALRNRSEDNVLPVKPIRLHRAQEELRTIRAWACVRHRQDAWPSVLQLKVLIRKLRAIDGLATSSVPSCEVATLAHELCDHTVERRALEVQRLSGLARTLLTGAQSPEVLSCFRDHISPELHDNTAGRGSTNGHVEEHFGLGHGSWFSGSGR